jgi:predicted N-acetyltransferase YhbS
MEYPMKLTLKTVPHGSPEYAEMVGLRYRILRQPLGLTFSEEQLSAEASDIHIAALAVGEVIGCLVLTPITEDVVQMRQVAVEERYQGQGIGTRLVAYAEQVAQHAGYRKMLLHARETVVPFYLRLEYAVEGETFLEVTLPHRQMAKELTPPLIEATSLIGRAFAARPVSG